MIRKAALYCRISRDRTGAGLGVERQERECRQLADRLGWEIVDVYQDNDLSAYSGKPRPGYQRMLADLRTGRADAVIAWHTDRLHRRSGRDSSGALDEYIDLCQAMDIPTQTVQAGALDLSTASGRMTARIHAAVSRGEVEHQIERQVASRRQAATDGRWQGNKRPFGFESDGMTIIPKERDAVLWACSQILQGMSLAATSKALNAKGIFTSTGRPWDSRTLARMLLRARNAGLSEYKGQIAGRAQWPALVPETTWKGVRAVLKDPARRATPGGPPKWLLTNLGRCGAVIDGKVCGNLVVSKSRGGKSKMIIYTCSAGAHLGRSAVEVDAYVREVVIGILTERGRGLLVPEGTDERMAELNARDAELAGKLAELGRSFKADLIDLPTVEAATAGIRSERAEITAELSAMARGSILSGVADAPDVARAFDACDLSRRRAIVDLLMTVTIGRASRGRRVGWKPGGSYFDHTTVTFEPK
jgi:DNA invertase Pin-like site-specific DNA recombinase